MKAKLLSLCCVSLLFCSCALSYPDPHENFIKLMNGRVGKKLYALENPREHKPISIKDLENGNQEYRYRQYGGCVEIYEVNPKTTVIVKAGFEGTQKQCVQKN